MSTYTVKKGDTLSSIAKKYGTTYQAIAKVNGISNPNYIRTGQTLTINGTAAPHASAATKQETQTATATPATTPSTGAASAPVTPVETQSPAANNYSEYKPSDAVSQAQQMLAQQMALKGTPSSGGSGGSGGSRGTNPDKNEESEMSVAEEYLMYKKNGASSRELDAFLKAAIAEGKISQAEATEIRNQRY